MSNVRVIAEAGVNHDGSLKKAKQLVDAAFEAGADAVKFQTFKAEDLVTPEAERASYQVTNCADGEKSQLDMLRKLELSQDDFKEIRDYAEQKGIEFLSTPFDADSARFLIDELGMKKIKIPSGELTNLPFIHFLAQFGLPVILSTGMSELKEVEAAVSVLKEHLSNDKIIILHCTSSYPCDAEDVNLRAMRTLKDRLGVEVGYSDHTLGIDVSIAAVALGASVLEKHLTLDRTSQGPDHAASLEPAEFKKMVTAIRRVEIALGSSEKKPTKSELETRKVARKSLTVKKALDQGSVLSDEDLVAKRPGVGISPADTDKVRGLKLKVKKNQNEVLEWDDVE